MIEKSVLEKSHQIGEHAYAREGRHRRAKPARWGCSRDSGWEGPSHMLIPSANPRGLRPLWAEARGAGVGCLTGTPASFLILKDQDMYISGTEQAGQGRSNVFAFLTKMQNHFNGGREGPLLPHTPLEQPDVRKQENTERWPKPRVSHRMNPNTPQMPV